MSKFRLVNYPTSAEVDQAFVFNDEYFTIDCAERTIADGWYNKNGQTIIYSLQNNEVIGFFVILPLTKEAGKLFEENQIREEEILPEHILPPESLKYAQSVYIAAIGIKNRNTLLGYQAVAAMMAGFGQLIGRDYDPAYLKTIFANPTTFDGNRITRKLGFGPVAQLKRSLRAGNDMYGLPVTVESFHELTKLEQRYDRFVEKYDWRD